MWRYLLQKLLIAVPTLLAVVTFVFLAMRLVPGDPAVIMAGDYADAATLAEIRRDWGLDRPLPVQYGLFLGNLVQGDLGKSIRSRQDVLYEVSLRLGVTVKLALLSILVAVVVGGVAGVVSAARPYTGWDYLSTLFALLGVSMPIFWSGLLLIILFSLRLEWLPTGGVGSFSHYILPAASLGVFSAGVIARQTRSSMLESLTQDYVRTARAKGVHEIKVILAHALRTSLIPIVTITGLQLGRMLAGAILVETVFNLPGMGSYLVLAISQRDYPVIQVIVMAFALSFMMINLLVDMIYPVLNPQVTNR
jgi:peptide/nickel transport system permease protein